MKKIEQKAWTGDCSKDRLSQAYERMHDIIWEFASRTGKSALNKQTSEIPLHAN